VVAACLQQAGGLAATLGASVSHFLNSADQNLGHNETQVLHDTQCLLRETVQRVGRACGHGPWTNARARPGNRTRLSVRLFSSLPPAETKASSSPAAPVTIPERRWPPVPCPTGQTEKIYEILVDDTSPASILLAMKPVGQIFVSGNPDSSQYYCWAEEITNDPNCD
jgi:hypothetical protein